ncbi:MAG TPA: hypothetical protein IAB59_05165 [Candidatus Onthousia faecipullorum]|uniref:Uncharacterized protein n=1 Tax=Candidatus Onthousia faecipullorum TaxID=2840887 RepID=A0A9D1GCP6_9FIRM|nr:hypothetical protein [Candidatus Onthousia faecipullorum]
MKSYKKKRLLLLSFVITFILTIVFFYLLVSVKLWTYNNVSILNIDDNVITVYTTLDLDLFKDNNFFYYDTLKYTYKINSKEDSEDGVILVLELEKSFKLVIDDMVILLPNKRETILSLIIDSWRVK